MSNIRSLLRKLVPLGPWNPDAVEFAPGLLDQVANAVPVFGVYRTIQRLSQLSVCPEDKRVTGTYVHRLSLDQSLDTMQPNWAESSPPFAPQRDFQVSPGSLLQPFPGQPNTGWNQFYKAINGLGANASTFIMFIPHDALSEILFGHFTRPRASSWDGINALKVSLQYHIRTGFVGSYEFWIRIGTVNSPIDQEASFVPVGEFHRAGNLSVDGTGAPTQVMFDILPGVLPANPHTKLWGWQLQHDIEAVGAGKKNFEPTETASVNPVDRQSGRISGWFDQAGSSLAADAALALDLADDVLTTNPKNISLIRTRPIYANEGSGLGIYIKMDLSQFVNLHDHEIIFNWSVGRTDQEVSLALLKTRDGGFVDISQPNGNLIQKWVDIKAANANTITKFHIKGPSLTEGVNPALIGQIQDWSKVWFFFFAEQPSGDTSTGLTEKLLRPDITAPAFYQELTTPPWTQFGVAASKLAAISDNNGTTGIVSPVSAGSFTSFNDVHNAVFFKLEPFDGSSGAIKNGLFRVAVEVTGGPHRIKFTLFDLVTGANYDTGSEGKFIQMPVGFGSYSLPMNANGLAKITNWNSVRMAVTIMADSLGTLRLAEVYLDFDTGPASVARLHGIRYIAPASTTGGSAPIDVSWIRLDGPASIATVEQDDLMLYAGTVDEPGHVPQEGRIYQMSSPDFVTWEDVSKIGGYFSNSRDKSWSFTGYGSMVIATNYANPVQVKGEGDDIFRDLIGFDSAGVAITGYGDPIASGGLGGVYPRARFAATINSFLCLGNCDPTSVTGVAQPYTFWCSRQFQPQYFATGSIEWQSSAFQLLATTGEITGLVGGEWGLIFKENSIWRADYAGLPQVFEFTQVSGMQGTTQSRSIVKIEDDAYFFSTGGIYVVRAGQQLEEVASPGSIRKFLFDSQFEQFAVSTFVASKESEQASRVIGGYDAYTGCIFWSYITQRVSGEDANEDDYLFKCDAILVYNPRENKFGFVAGDGVTVFSDDTRIVEISDLFSGNTLEVNGFFSLGNRQLSAGTYLHKTILATSGIAPKLMSFSAIPDGIHGGTYEQFFRSGTIPSTYFGAKPGVEVALQQIRPILAVEKRLDAPEHTIWIEANQSPAIGDGSGRVISVSSANAHPDGWIDLGIPLSGEWFKFATVFNEANEPILKEFHGWQIIYSIKGDH